MVRRIAHVVALAPVAASLLAVVACVTASPIRDGALMGKWGQVEGIPIVVFLADGDMILLGSPHFAWEGDAGEGKYWMQTPLAPQKIDFVYELLEEGTRLHIHFRTPGSELMDLYKLP